MQPVALHASHWTWKHSCASCLGAGSFSRTVVSRVPSAGVSSVVPTSDERGPSPHSTFPRHPGTPAGGPGLRSAPQLLHSVRAGLPPTPRFPGPKGDGRADRAERLTGGETLLTSSSANSARATPRPPGHHLSVCLEPKARGQGLALCRAILAGKSPVGPVLCIQTRIWQPMGPQPGVVDKVLLAPTPALLLTYRLALSLAHDTSSEVNATEVPRPTQPTWLWPAVS